MNTLKWIASNWDGIVAVLVVLAGIVGAVRHGESAKLEALLLNLVTDMELTYGSGVGQLKLSGALSKLYELTPAFIRCLFTERQLEQMLEDVLAEPKHKWQINPNYKALLEQPE